MSRANDFLLRIIKNPLRTILVIIAVGVAAIGIYVGGPWYSGGPTSAIGATIESDIIRLITGLFYLVPSIMALVGVYTHNARLRYYGEFGLFLSLVFIVVLRLVTFGFVPVVWIPQMALALIAGVLWLARDDGE